MTIDEFLTELAALDADWTWKDYGFEHFALRTTTSDCVCPVVALANAKGLGPCGRMFFNHEDEEAGLALGLSPESTRAIVAAADRNQSNPMLRRLLAACSLA